MNRVSNISSPADVALEHEREGLRDRRSLRRGKMLVLWARLAASVTGLGFFLVHLLPLLRGSP